MYKLFLSLISPWLKKPDLWAFFTILGLMLCCYCPDVLNHFISENVFCKCHPVGWWRMCISRRSIWIWMSTITWMQCSLCHMGTEPRGPTMCEKSSSKASMTCDTSLWVSETQQPQEIMSSVQSRISLIRKKTMAFWGTQMNKECYNILLILLLHINQSLMVKIMA